ncbi:hypothetical protein [Micromonospora echinaurantiaca]|uniref:hypothetical protein n=1 Tax=Micromonospora echinaurantiaca TaxID=47857 RepID=UPI0034322D36
MSAISTGARTYELSESFQCRRAVARDAFVSALRSTVAGVAMAVMLLGAGVLVAVFRPN